jgi:hypothetical protein
MEVVKFHFDPICPWCYQTSRWAKRLEQLGEIELDWGLFSLEVVNLEEGLILANCSPGQGRLFGQPLLSESKKEGPRSVPSTRHLARGFGSRHRPSRTWQRP